MASVSKKVQSSIALFFALLGVLLSGCIGEETELESSDEEREEGAQGTASISGRVLTESLEPVSGALVVLVGAGEEVAKNVTDGSGHYLIDGVEPGEYQVQVNAVCCHQVVQGTKLMVGDEREMFFQMEEITEKDLGVPFEEILDWYGFVGCSFVTATEETGGYVWTCPDDNQDLQERFTVTKGLKSIVVTFDWDPEASNLEGTLRIWLEKGSTRLAQHNGDPPIHFRVDAGETDGEDHDLENIEDEWGLRFRVWAGGYINVVYQQPFVVDYHLFYNERAPDGYKARDV